MATANAPWKVGEKILGTECEIKIYDVFVKSYINIYRVFLGMTQNGCYLVQDFFDEINDNFFTEHEHDKDYKPQKRTNPYLLLPCADPTKPTYPRSPPDHLEGYYITWYLSGGIESLRFYEEGENTISYYWDEMGNFEHKNDTRIHFKDIFF